MEKPLFTHPNITLFTTVTEDKQLTHEHKVTWYEYQLQEAVIFHGIAAIVSAVTPQYIEEKELDCLGYIMESIITLISHLRTWPVIKNLIKDGNKGRFCCPLEQLPQPTSQRLRAISDKAAKQRHEV